VIKRDPHITVEAAIELTGWDRATIFRKLGNAELIGKRADEKSGNGQHATLVQVLSLPSEAQVTYWDRTLNAPLVATTPVNFAEYPEGSLKEANRRVPIVLEAIEIKRERVQVTNRLHDLAARAGEHVRTIERWVTAYRQHGTPGLLPAWGKTKDGNSTMGRFLAITPENGLDEYIHALCLVPAGTERPTATSVYKSVQSYCNTPGVAVPCPSVATINKFLNDKVRYSALVLARQGPRAWAAKCMPKINRDPMKHAVGEIWVGDHREMDVLICLRIVKKDGTVEIIKFRPWLTAWYDVRSRKCVGYVLCRKPNKHSIAASLRNAILSHGVPKAADGGPGLLYVDNGKDYKSHYLNGDLKLIGKIDLPDEVKLMLGKGVLHPLGIEIQHAKPYAAWQKPIEQWFGHTFPQWECTLPGWTGRDAKHRPEKLAGEIERDELLELHDFEARLSECVAAYHRAGHGGDGMEGATPDSCWVGHPIAQIDPRQLDIMLMPHKPVKVIDQGIKLFGRYYRAQVLKTEHVGHYVEAKYDPSDLSYLVVMKNNKFVCVAQSDAAWSFRPSEEQLKDHRKGIAVARARTERYIDDHRMLMNPEAAFRRRVANESNVKQLAPPRDPSPAAGTIAGRPRVASVERSAFADAADAVDRVHAARPATPEPFLEPVEEIPAALLVNRRQAVAQDEPEDDAFLQRLLRKKG
jgi:transposase InsO family protein